MFPGMLRTMTGTPKSIACTISNHASVSYSDLGLTVPQCEIVNSTSHKIS